MSLASGTWYFRFKKTETHKASAAVAVTVPEYYNASLQAAATPVAANFTTTATTSASDNDGTIVIDSSITPTTLEYKLSTDTSYTKVTAATIGNLASGTYDIRVAASSEYNASAAIQVVVKKFTAAPDASKFTVTKATSDTAEKPPALIGGLGLLYPNTTNQLLLRPTSDRSELCQSRHYGTNYDAYCLFGYYDKLGHTLYSQNA